MDITEGIMRTKIQVTLLVSVVILTGCAFGTRTAQLTYPPEETGDSLIQSAYAGDAGPGGRQVVVLSVTDERQEKNRIGNVRNTFGMDTANVVTNDDVRVWVENALKQDLERAGYAVVPAGGPDTDNPIGLQASILKVYCDVYLTYDGEVSLMLNLQGRDRSPVTKEIEGEGSVGMNWAATAKSYAESLALALQSAISKVVAELGAY